MQCDIRYIHERAKAFQMINEHEKAILDFDSVIQKNPKNAHAYFRRAFSHKAVKVSERIKVELWAGSLRLRTSQGTGPLQSEVSS